MPELPSPRRPSGRDPGSLRFLRAIAANLLIALVVAGCSGKQPVGQDSSPQDATPPAPGTTSEPTASPTPNSTRDATPEPTLDPEAGVVPSQLLVYAWQSGDYVSYQVIIEITNHGDGWAELATFNSDYQILDRDGGLVVTGNFPYLWPAFVGPGETAYLIDDGIEDNVDPGAFASVETDAQYDLANKPDTTFTFQNLELRPDDYQDGYFAAGFVTADADLTDAAVTVLCMDAEGVPLGATWNFVQNLTAGQREGFETIGATPPLDPSDCTELRGLAQDTGF